MIIYDETLMYCPRCGRVLSAEDADIITTPATWGPNGGSPEEREWKCPDCGEELEVVEYFCKACGEPIVFESNGYYDSCGWYCDTCRADMAKIMVKAFKDVAEELGISVSDAVDMVADYAEETEWFKEDLK